MSDTTVIIKTIGRNSLKAAIASSKREGFKTIVISDGVKTNASGANQFIKLGRQWGFYGGMAANVGAAVAETEFITFLDDDDQFVPGAGDVIRMALRNKPAIDIWIAGVRFNQEVRLYNTETGEVTYKGKDLAVWPEKGLAEGNVAMPTYRTKIFEQVPFINAIPDDVAHMTDLLHVQACASKGYSYDWFREALYLVKPHASHAAGIEAVNSRGR